MRSSKQRSRSKPNRNRSSVGNIVNRVFDSSGPEGKVRGTPQQIIDKYNQLARDAQLSNDRVATENFQQHSEHYTRMLSEAMREAEARREQNEGQQNNAGGGNGQNGQQNRNDPNRGPQGGDRGDRNDRGAHEGRDERGQDSSDDSGSRQRGGAPAENRPSDTRLSEDRQVDDRQRDSGPTEAGREATDGAAPTAPRRRTRARSPDAPAGASDVLDLSEGDAAESGLVDTPEGKADKPRRKPRKPRAPKGGGGSEGGGSDDGGDGGPAGQGDPTPSQAAE